MLCFKNSTSDNDPFVSLDFSKHGDGHYPYDLVMKRVFAKDAYMMTTLRDPINYAQKFYRVRKIFDKPSTHIHDLSFHQWQSQTPWRNNQMTRMIGRADGDNRVMKHIMKPQATDDKYMQEQNNLGEDSEILKRAWERLSEKMVWFGLFHRLTDSMELLAFTTCAAADELVKGYNDKPLEKGTAQLSIWFAGVDANFPEDDAEKKEILEELQKRNKLDLILLARAEELFDRRLEEMREAKARGVICNFMGTVEVTCGETDDEF